MGRNWGLGIRDWGMGNGDCDPKFRRTTRKLYYRPNNNPYSLIPDPFLPSASMIKVKLFLEEFFLFLGIFYIEAAWPHDFVRLAHNGIPPF